MKRLRKLIAGIITLAMAMSMLSMTTLAAPTTGGSSGATTVQETDETIDTTKKGSLTLYKYEFKDGTSTGSTAGTGLGGQTIPDGATVIEDVGFTLYKVADLDDYYKADGKELPTAPTPGSAEETTLINAATKIETEKFTDENGKVYWDNLNLGIYYVVESTKPVSSISAPVNFYVSIPMTKTDGSGWLYDIVVYPKNTTSYAGVILKKIGNDNDTALLKGAKFVLQKYDGTTWKYVVNEGTDATPAYTYGGTDKVAAAVFTTGDNGTIAIDGLSYGIYQFVETYAPDGYIMDETVTHQFVIGSDGKIYKYDSATPGTNNEYRGDEITDKIIKVNNEKPDVEKEVKNATTGKWGDDADYSIGDTVPFKILIDVPSNVDKLETFKVTDTMSTGLTNATNFAIKGYVTYTSETANTGEATISVTPSISGQEWTIDFKDVKSTIKSYEKIVITFDATLNKDAAVIAGTGNPNDVKLTYSNQILTDKTQTPDESELTDEVVVYTFKIVLTKTFEDATAADNFTAKFQLYRENASSAETLKVGNNDVKVEKVGNEVTVSKGTPYSFEGLENGTYYLVETATQSGYNLLKEPVKAPIAIVYKTTITTTSTTDGNGKVTETTTHTTEYYKDTAMTQSLTDTNIAQTIVNSKGFTLPTTGGIGTFVFTFVGIAMMAAAVILFITSRKKKEDK